MTITRVGPLSVAKIAGILGVVIGLLAGALFSLFSMAGAAFGAASFDVLEQRTNDSISAVASMIAGAWEQAGRPKVPIALERPPRPIRRKP